MSTMCRERLNTPINNVSHNSSHSGNWEYCIINIVLFKKKEKGIRLVLNLYQNAYDRKN